MKIGLDATPIGVDTTDKGGVFHYITNLLDALREAPGEHEFVLLFNFCRSRHLEEFSQARSLFDNSRFKVVRRRVPSALWMTLPIPVETLIGCIDVFHGLYDFVPPVLFGAAVVTIHDLRYVSIEESFDPEVVRLIEKDSNFLDDYRHRLAFFRRQRKIIRKVARRAELVIAPSEFSKRSIVDTLGLSATNVRVVYHGLSSDLFFPVDSSEICKVLQHHRIRRPYILFVGKIDPLKNLSQLLRALHEIRVQLDVHLVLVGQAGWHREVLVRLIDELKLREHVSFLGHVPEEDLKSLYSGAEAFVFPSLFEGFGMPVVEAMACGTPVVCSKLCSLPEVAGDAAVLVDPSSVEALTSGILQVLSDSELRQSLVRKGLERARLFTWEKTSEQTLAVYEEAARR